MKKSTEGVKDHDSTMKPEYKMEIIWFNVAVLTLIHLMGLYGYYLLITNRKFLLFFFSYGYSIIAGIGVTAGAHRLWSHKAYKADLPLRVLLMLLQAASIQKSIYDWVRDHRAHHKYTDTDADPHNSRRGFFFSHVGWLLVKKHLEVTNRGQAIDMSDILNDPVVAFQKKYYWILAPLLGFALPTLIPMYFWGESFTIAFFVTIARYVTSLNGTWLVNSAAHIYGPKSYDKRSSSAENLIVAIITYGEGWHNYHHAFPWDYKAAELPNYKANWSTAFIDFTAWLGFAYDLKFATPDMIRKCAEKNGDGNWVQTNISN